VRRVQVGDWVSVPFNVACGKCDNCKQRLTNLCQSVNEKKIGGAYGFADMGGWRGGQSEYNVVPFADYQCLVLPKDDCRGRMLDVAMLSDILPTGFHAAVKAKVGVGRTVFIAGGGPVGICCAASCILLGAAAVVVGDVNPHRLANVRRLGPLVQTLDVSTLESDEPDAVNTRLKELTGKSVVDCACDCVGFEASGLGPACEENRQEAALHAVFAAAKSGGSVSSAAHYGAHRHWIMH
jgi:glutathione-independent formaldehyde dehydrogenase